MSAQIDLERFGYALKHGLDLMGLSYRQAHGITGVSVRQISDAIHGKRIEAGATIMLARLVSVQIDDLFSGVARERLAKIRKVQALHEEQINQAVTPLVPRETTESAA